MGFNCLKITKHYQRVIAIHFKCSTFSIFIKATISASNVYENNEAAEDNKYTLNKYTEFTLSIIAKMRSTRFSGVFSSSGNSTVFPCKIYKSGINYWDMPILPAFDSRIRNNHSKKQIICVWPIMGENKSWMPEMSYPFISVWKIKIHFICIFLHFKTFLEQPNEQKLWGSHGLTVRESDS